MKKHQLVSALTILTLFLGSCSGEETKATEEGSAKDNSSSEHASDNSNNVVESSLKNEITTLKYNGSDQSFDQKYVYANYSKTYLSYRVMYLNYDKSEDSDFGSRTGDQTKIVVFLHNPADGEFKPGKYTPDGDENGMNKGFAQIENAEGIMTINTAVDDPGYIEIIDISNTHIVGEYHLKGKVLSDNSDFEISGSFNTKHEAVN